MKALLLMLVLLFATAAYAADPVNVNTADAEALASLEMIGPAKASAIIAWRDENGPFESVQSLTNVPGIGEATVERNLDRITLD